MAKSHDMGEFVKTLMSDLDPQELLDILFYNFYDLDRFNRAEMGDGVLFLGMRDPIHKYMQRKLKKGEQGDLEAAVDIIKHEGAEMDEETLEEMLQKALKLVEMADQLKYHPIFNPITEEEKIDLQKQIDEQTIDFQKKYGLIGKKLQYSLGQFASKSRSKWGDFTTVQRSKKKFLENMKRGFTNSTSHDQRMARISTQTKGDRKNRLHSAMPDYDDEAFSVKSSMSGVNRKGPKNAISGFLNPNGGLRQPQLKKTQSYYENSILKRRGSKTSLKRDSLNNVSNLD